MNKFEQFHLRWRGQVTGPYTWADIERKLDAHEIGLLHDLQQNNNWTTLGEYLAGRAEAFRVTAAVPSVAANSRLDAIPDAAAASSSTIRIPNRWIFIGLGLFFGFLGLHDFYAHHWFRGAFLLGLGILFFWIDWGIVWPWLWAIGEILLTKFDGKRRRMNWTRVKLPKRPPSPPPPSAQ